MFFKKTKNEKAAISFWKWFKRNEIWIISKYATSKYAVTWAIEDRLKPSFSRIKEALKFELGFTPEKGTFYLYTLGNEKILKSAEFLKNMMPAGISDHWDFVIA